LRYCSTEEITFTRSRPGRKNDGAHVEQKNWSIVRRAVGYHRYDTLAELDLLNRIYALLRLQTNFFAPQQKLVSKTRKGAKVIKRHDVAQTPYQRLLGDERIDDDVKTALTRQYRELNPAQLRRDILALSDQLLELTRTKRRMTPATAANIVTGCPGSSAPARPIPAASSSSANGGSAPAPSTAAPGADSHASSARPPAASLNTDGSAPDHKTTKKTATKRASTREATKPRSRAS